MHGMTSLHWPLLANKYVSGVFYRGNERRRKKKQLNSFCIRLCCRMSVMRAIVVKEFGEYESSVVNSEPRHRHLRAKAMRTSASWFGMCPSLTFKREKYPAPLKFDHRSTERFFVQVLIRVHAAGVNPVDTYIRSGSYSRRPTLPYIPGLDSAGTIERVGAEVTKFKVNVNALHARTHGTARGLCSFRLAIAYSR